MKIPANACMVWVVTMIDLLAIDSHNVKPMHDSHRLLHAQLNAAESAVSASKSPHAFLLALSTLFTLLKASSIGLKSGLYGGKK